MGNQKRIVRLYLEDADWLWGKRQVINGEKETMADAFKRIVMEVKKI
jgi:hypothetical protein